MINPNVSMYSLISECSALRPEVVAVEYYGKHISYKHLIENIDICASSLSARGISKGEHIAVVLPNIPEAVYLFYAGNKIGAIVDMIHPLSCEEELIEYVHNTDCKLVFALDLIVDRFQSLEDACSKVIKVSASDSMSFIKRTAYSLASKKSSFSKKITRWNSFFKQCNGVETADVSANDVAAILYSGGTTGKSKGIMLTNYNFNSVAIDSIDSCACLNQGDRVLALLPVFHGFGLGVCVHTTFLFGGTSLLIPKVKASDFGKLLMQVKPNVIAAVPSLYSALLRENSLKPDFSYVKCIISGGDSMHLETKKKVDEFFLSHGSKVKVREGYGLTECVTGTCLLPENSDKDGSVGLPYKSFLFKIADPVSRIELPVNTEGEILVSGPSVMKGYINEPEETNHALEIRSDGKTWLHTGDLGYIDNDGFVYFKQRIKRMIVINGYNVYPQIIENIVCSLSTISQVAVVGVEHPICGQVPRVYAVPSNTEYLEAELIDSIHDLCATHLAAYAVPRDIRIVDQLPRTKIGKIDYVTLSKEA